MLTFFVNFYLKKDLKAPTGFLLVETLVSFAILTIGILAVITLFNSTIRLTTESNQRLIAQGLAQEPHQWLRKIRDEKILNSASSLVWNNSVDACDNGATCILGYPQSCFYYCAFICLASRPPELLPITLPADSRLKYNDQWGYYQAISGGCLQNENTIYSREISLGGSAASGEMVFATSSISWENHGNKSLELVSEYLSP